jgi:hypothetical protein
MSYTSHEPPNSPTEGAISQCATCDALFLGADRYDNGHIQWIPLRWWHRGWLRAKLARFPKP